MEAPLIILSIVIVIAVIAMAIVLYNFMLLISEMNKRLIYIITDILANINLETPHLDSLNPEEQKPEVDLKDIMDEEQTTQFNPHDFDVEKFNEDHKEDNF